MKTIFLILLFSTVSLTAFAQNITVTYEPEGANIHAYTTDGTAIWDHFLSADESALFVNDPANLDALIVTQAAVQLGAPAIVAATTALTVPKIVTLPIAQAQATAAAYQAAKAAALTTAQTVQPQTAPPIQVKAQ